MKSLTYLYYITTMKRIIIGAVGFIGSGKGTVGEYLVNNHNFYNLSFAKTLKDAVAAIFGWPRNLLEGDTAESRLWREQPDAYWTYKLGKPITPRWVLQYIGTDVMRDHFHNNIWIDSLEKQIHNHTGNIVITDVRFANEIQMIQRLNGAIMWIKKDPLPIWFSTAQQASLGNTEAKDLMNNHYRVHESEWAWTGQNIQITINNNGSITELYNNVEKCISNL